MAEYIGKQAAYEVAFRECICHGGEPMNCYNSAFCERLIDAFVAAPAADVAEVRHGRWIDTEDSLPWCEDDVEIVSMCSACGALNALGETRYCPNCGARMDGGADNETD